MPRLLDTRLIGQDIGDVSSRDYSAARPGQVLQVGPDGSSMVLDAGANFSYLSRDAEAERSGISVQQFLCRLWHDITPVFAPAVPPADPVLAYGAIYGTTYAFGVFWIAGADTAGRAKISSSLVDAITGSAGVETGWSDSFTWIGGVQYNVGVDANGNRTLSPFSGPVYGVIYENGLLFAYGANGRIAVLGSTGWEPCTVDGVLVDSGLPRTSATYSIYRIAYGHRKGWVAVGTETSVSTSPGITLTSIDGFNWKTSTPALGLVNGVAVPIYGVAYGGSFYGQNFFIAVGGVQNITTNHIAYSLDGVNWTQQISAHPNRAHYAVAFGNGRWVIGTQREPVTGTPGSSMICSTVGLGSTTVLTWESVTGDSNGNIQALAYGNGIFVAGSYAIFAGVSGQDIRPLSGTAYAGWAATSACYGNGIFLMGSRNGKLARSSVITEILSSII